MPVPKGVRVGGGSRKGIPNKATADIKAMIVEALQAEGGVEYMRQQARENPVAFMSLVGRVLPLQVTGANGGPVLGLVMIPPKGSNGMATIEGSVVATNGQAQIAADNEPDESGGERGM